MSLLLIARQQIQIQTNLLNFRGPHVNGIPGEAVLEDENDQSIDQITALESIPENIGGKDTHSGKVDLKELS